MIKDIKKKDNKGKTFYSFTLGVEIYGLLVESTGWKYWPESGIIRPPAANTKGRWVPTFRGVSEVHQEAIRKRLTKILDNEGEDKVELDVETGRKRTDDELEKVLDKFLPLYGPEQFAELLKIELEKEEITQADFDKVVELLKGRVKNDASKD